MVAWRPGKRRELAALAALGLALAALMTFFATSAAASDTAGRATGPAPTSVESERAALGVLERHCARCHQSGRLEWPAPAGALGTILDLKALAAERHWVVPGNPDASPLYQLVLGRSMPPDARGSAGGRPAPTGEEAAQLRAWIEGLPPAADCKGTAADTPGDRWAPLAKLAGRGDAKDLRIVTLAHLADACIAEDVLAGYRKAVTRLWNSLSTKPDPVVVAPLEEAPAHLVVSLSAIGWTTERWERLVAAGGDPLGPMPRSPAALSQALGSESPIARADWLARTALTAPLYYELLGLPEDYARLLTQLGLAAGATSAKAGERWRAAIERSRFAGEASLIERIAGPSGVLWQAYHGTVGNGPGPVAEAARSPEASLPHRARRGMLALPNGFPAFIVLDEQGRRLDQTPPDLGKAGLPAARPTRAGLECLACHVSGPAVRAPEDRGRADAALVAGDAKAVAEAFGRVGLDSMPGHGGIEPLVALAREHERAADAKRVAAELGIRPEALARLAGEEGAAGEIALRLLQGPVGRREIEAHAAALRRAAANGPGAGAEGDARADQGKPSAAPDGLVLFAGKPAYRLGDTLSLAVRAPIACHPTVISIDQRGRGTVLYPNDFQQTSAKLAPGETLVLPPKGSGYSFRINEPGRERIVALCATTEGLVDGIRHDFERQRFTDVGNYASHLALNGLVEPEGEEASPREERTRGRRRGRPEPVELRAKPESVLRTGIVIVVE